MTSPRLRELERNLLGGTTQKANAVSYTEMEMAVGRVKAAEEKQRKAETDALEALKEVDKLQGELNQMRKEANEHALQMQAQAMQMQKQAGHEANEMRECHKKEMQKMQEDMSTLKDKLASECQARAKAESQLEILKGQEARMNALVANLKIPAPIVQNQAAPARSATATVNKRDGNGRIVSFTITSSS